MRSSSSYIKFQSFRLQMSEFFLHRYRKIDPTVDMSCDPRQAIRINPAKAPEERVVSVLRERGVQLEKIPWISHGYFADADFSLGATKEYLLGWYYLQGPLSQLACEALRPEGNVLDMAAAPGGKTTYLALLAELVVALDNNPARLATVRNNVERLGLANVVCMRKDARFARELGMQFDRVLLDAPCSGNFCSEEGWAEKRTIHDIRKNARLQRELLASARSCCRTGGRIVYSTCSLEPEEDELIVDWALGRFDDLAVVPFDPGIGDSAIVEWEGRSLDASLAGTRRFWPHRTGCEGFYIAVLERR